MTNITQGMTEEKMEEVASQIKDILGYEAMGDFIKFLQSEKDSCPEGICDGSGKVGKTFIDEDSHTSYSDGLEDCLCTK